MKQFFTILMVLFCSFSYGQNQTATLKSDDLVERFNGFISEFPQEKYHLHLAKRYYAGGEVVWFKIYQLNAFTNRPASLSKVAKVQLIDITLDSVLAEYPVKTEDGRGDGSIKLPENLKSGPYLVRVFNNWMLNFDHDLIHDQLIYVGGSKENTGSAAGSPSADRELELLFYPESGGYLKNMTCRMVIQALETDGSGMVTNGVILNTTGDTVQTFFTNKFGLGSFYFRTTTDDRFRAQAISEDGSLIKADLPKPGRSGYSFSVFETGDAIRVSIYSTPDKYGDSTMLILSASGRIYFTAKSSSGEEPTPVIFDRAQLPPGTALLSLIDLKTGKTVNERMLFIDDENKAQTRIEDLSKSYHNRENVTLNLVVDNLREGEKAFLSASVYQVFDSAERNSIGERGTKRDFDHLLMTRSWKRYNWQQVVAGESMPASRLLERDGFLMEGYVIDRNNGKLLSNQEITVTSPEDPQVFHTGTTDQDGRFMIYNMNWTGLKEIVVKLNDTLTSTAERDIIVGPFRTKKKYPETYPNGNLRLFEDQLDLKNRITQIYGTVDYVSSDVSVSDKTAFYGQPDRIVRLDDYEEMPGIVEVFRELLVGVRLRYRDGLPEIRVMELTEDISDRTRSTSFSEKPPYLFVNNVRVYDEGFITKLTPAQIARFEIVYSRNKKYEYIDVDEDDREFSGLLAVYMEPQYFNIDDIEGVHKVMVNGYPKPLAYKSVELESPDARIPDFRDLLYWDPNIELNQEGKAQLQFSASDITGRFRIEVDGFTSSGQRLFGTTDFTVGLNE